jgi:hypothetical protein
VSGIQPSHERHTAKVSPDLSRLRQLLLQLRQDLEQVPDEAVVGDLEDRCLLASAFTRTFTFASTTRFTGTRIFF